MNESDYAQMGRRTHDFVIFFGASVLVAAILTSIFGEFSQYNWITWVSLFCGGVISFFLRKSRLKKELALQTEKVVVK